MSICHNKKKIMFLTGTRADFGHQKPLIDRCIESGYDVSIFITGMHTDDRHGKTLDEVGAYGYESYSIYSSHIDDTGNRINSMDLMLSNTIKGFSSYVKLIQPDLIVIFADRFEALAGAIVGALNNVLTVHVQAGDSSGTIDDSMRHAISKLCHAHFVSTEESRLRLLKMGENGNNIFKIGTPGLDVLFSEELPSLESSKKKYNVDFDRYSILIFHPVTTEFDEIENQIKQVSEAIVESDLNYLVVCPNNDMGSCKIFKEYDEINSERIKIFQSIDHFDFLTLLRNADFIIGNSSCGVIEAPCYAVPTINIGSRQQNRTDNKDIINCSCSKEDILKNIDIVKSYKIKENHFFGDGHSAERFVDIINRNGFLDLEKQKKFIL